MFNHNSAILLEADGRTRTKTRGKYIETRARCRRKKTKGSKRTKKNKKEQKETERDQKGDKKTQKDSKGQKETHQKGQKSIKNIQKSSNLIRKCPKIQVLRSPGSLFAGKFRNPGT